MAVFLLRGNTVSEARAAIESGLKATIPGLIEVTSFARVFEQISAAERSEQAIILVVAPPGDSGYFNRLVDVAAQYHNEVFIILISEEISASDYKRLMRTGGADWVSAKAGPREVADIIARLRRDTGATNKDSSDVAAVHPVTISFVPSAGGVGNTTLAIETAVHLKTSKASRQRNICIVDLDFQTSHVCDYLDSEPRLLIEEFSNAPERLDKHLFDSFKTHHKSGIDVFAAPRSKYSSEELDINALDALFSMIAESYNLVLIDFPLTWFSWTPQVLAASDGAVITGLNTIPNLRQISEMLATIRLGPAVPKIGIVLNRCEQTMFGSISRRKQVEKVLPNEKLFFIADHEEAITAVNMGVPMTLGASAGKLHKEFAAVSDFCAEIRTSRRVSV